MLTVTRVAYRAAPFLRRDVRNGLRKDPMTSCKILGLVLSFAVRKTGRPLQNSRTAAFRVFAMTVDVLNADHDTVAIAHRLRGIGSADDNRTVADR
jgi:hypothetical protein